MSIVHGLDTTNFPLDILYGEGVMFAGATKVGVSKGPPKWNPARTYQNIDFDGKHAPMKGLDRPMLGEATIALTMLEIGTTSTGNQIDKFEPGNTDATVSTVQTFTPAPSGILLASGAYVTDFRVLWERGSLGSGNYFAVYFPNALCTKYDIAGASKSEALISVEFAARLTLSSTAINAAPYALEYRTSLPS